MICKSCGVEAPTKYVEFYQNIGAVFTRYHKAVKGNLCKSCINEHFWKFTLVNLTLGWWGVISFFLTPFLILNNVIRYLGTLKLQGVPVGATAQTGEKPPIRERSRIWFNTSDGRPSLPQEPEPSRDSSVEDLIKYLGCANNSEFRRLAAELLGQMGSTATSAMPALLIACIDINATVRQAALNALETIDPGWTQNPAVHKTLPELAKEFKHAYCFKNSFSKEVSQAVYNLLQQIGEPAVSSLANLIVEEEDKIEYKIRAISILRGLGSDAASAVPQLIQALRDKASKVRLAAAEALVSFGPVAKVAVPEIIVGLADRDVEVRKAMVACLVATEPAVPDLLPLMADQNPNVRKAVADALLQIGSQTIPMLIQTVSQWCTKPKTDIDNFEKFQKMTETALHVLGKFGSDASSAKPTIALALVDPNLSIKFAAVQALINLDLNWMSNPVVVEAIASLAEPRNSAENPEEIAGEIVVQTFIEIGAAAVPMLIDALTVGDRVTRQNAARALGQIGAEAKTAIPALTRALEDNHSLVQYEAARALQKINDPAS